MVGQALDEERAGRAMATAIQTGSTKSEATVDLLCIKEQQAVSAWLAEGKVNPFYEAPNCTLSTDSTQPPPRPD